MSKPLMIAHRGYSGFEKENTLVAFSAAGVQEEYYGIETDVHVTNDGHYVVIHDENVSRVTNERIDLDVEKNSFEMVRKVKLSDVDGSCNRTDLRIPEMIEYFRICKKYDKVAVLELKQVFNKEQIQEIYDIIKSLDYIDKTVIISFILEDLILLREIDHDMTAQYLLCKFEEKHIETLLKYNLDVDALWSSMNEDSIALCHKNNIKVNIWTVDNQEDANRYASWGVDYITSNRLKNTY